MTNLAKVTALVVATAFMAPTIASAQMDQPSSGNSMGMKSSKSMKKKSRMHNSGMSKKDSMGGGGMKSGDGM